MVYVTWSTSLISGGKEKKQLCRTLDSSVHNWSADVLDEEKKTISVQICLTMGSFDKKKVVS